MPDKPVTKCLNGMCQIDVVPPHEFCSEECMEEYLEIEARKAKPDPVKEFKSNKKLIIISSLFAVSAVLFYLFENHFIIP